MYELHSTVGKHRYRYSHIVEQLDVFFVVRLFLYSTMITFERFERIRIEFKHLLEIAKRIIFAKISSAGKYLRPYFANFAATHGRRIFRARTIVIRRCDWCSPLPNRPNRHSNS